jgi:peptidoglycan/LPS O-acetylase OafA/YrhL
MRNAYKPQLDSLRALAVFGVMVHHFWPEAEAALGLTVGFLGVQLFFVLSGFLITGILLQIRDAVECGRLDNATAVSRFYLRRFLRIFPLFYGTLAIAWIAGVPEVRDSILWHVTYLTNVYFFRIRDWHGSISHLWSLAVEEQFYLVWPFVILFTPRRAIGLVLAGVVLLAPLFRFYVAWADVHWMASYVLPFGNCDALALGALLAHVSQSGAAGAPRSGLVRAGLWVGVPLAGLLWVLEWNHLRTDVSSWFRIGFENTVWALAFVWLIDGASRGFRGAAGWVLDRRPLIYVGRISYGLYVIHPFMPHIVRTAYFRVGATFPATTPGQFLVLMLASVVMASMSWLLYERPINDLKRHFTYA